MFDNQSATPNQSPNNVRNDLSANKVTPPAYQAKSEAGEPEDIFKNVDPAPVSPPAGQINYIPNEHHEASEPVIKNTPSIFSQTASKPLPPVSPNIPELTASKNLDRKSIILLILIALIIVGTVAATIWWFIGYRQKKDSATNSLAVNLFNEINNSNQPPATNNLNADTGANANQADLSVNQNTNTANLPVANSDADGDGLTDEEEASLGTSSDSADTDNDGLFDREEFKVYKTDPLKSDTDGDGSTDGEEVQAQKDPLKADVIIENNLYQDSNHKFSFSLLPGMVKGEESSNVLVFNDDINQIKFYIYFDFIPPADLPAPDIRYLVSIDPAGFLTIKNQERLSDQTPYSTDLQTVLYESSGGNFYLLRYVATKKAENHQNNFEALIRSFKPLP
ncbi:MAG TPA: hypothetical protein PLR18_01890 [bacterium]|nr:hypothetical protein [bacterium]